MPQLSQCLALPPAYHLQRFAGFCGDCAEGLAPVVSAPNNVSVLIRELPHCHGQSGAELCPVLPVLRPLELLEGSGVLNKLPQVGPTLVFPCGYVQASSPVERVLCLFRSEIAPRPGKGRLEMQGQPSDEGPPSAGVKRASGGSFFCVGMETAPDLSSGRKLRLAVRSEIAKHARGRARVSGQEMAW